MKRRNIALAAAAFTAAWCGTARADEDNERRLQQQLEDLQRKFDDLSQRVADGSSRSEDELEQRIAELEKTTKKDMDGLFPYWNKGVKLDSVDGAFKVAFTGRIQNDYVFWKSEDEVTEALGETNSATEFRRARLGAQGTIYRNTFFKFEMDFANGGVNFADALIELSDVFCGPGINFRVGHFDEPFGLDRVTSSKYSTFVERGLQEAFVPGRNTGFMFLGEAFEKRMSYFLGFFRDANGAGDDLGNDNQGEHNITGRVAGRPWVNEDGTEFVHLGLAASHRNPSNETVRYRSRPEVHVGPQFVDTGDLTGVDTAFLWDLEASAVVGPFSVQGEWMNSSLDEKGDDGTDGEFSARSIQASYFLTGENRAYETKGARFDRVSPKRNWGKDGFGAWEVALRYSKLNLNDGPIDGGHLTDWTFGVNWYLNPNTRIMLNVIRADRQDLDPITAVVVRFMVDW